MRNEYTGTCSRGRQGGRTSYWRRNEACTARISNSSPPLHLNFHYVLEVYQRVFILDEILLCQRDTFTIIIVIIIIIPIILINPPLIGQSVSELHQFHSISINLNFILFDFMRFRDFPDPLLPHHFIIISIYPHHSLHLSVHP